ncbi:purine nucleoside phosphorylase-like isoform X2 [Teleopsis dalmanni]|uniref:purine nucleoside phosphorylase-like isoform X2 n=1 Tax=Teleopsis dalmanni TaxID=139649 RepID=UPI0018CE59C3|nr:purine nucleoside phosphorylase-like isoform X2 [Teleopsis dalmanni]
MAFLSCSNTDRFNEMKEAADYIMTCTDIRPRIGIICGSGLGKLAEGFTDAISFEYEKLPHFPLSTVEGHAGRLVFGYIETVPILAMQGRFHHYEGYSLSKCTFPVRVMKLIGIEILIATNAAGGINEKYKVGDIMLLRDHVNFLGLSGNSPLNGANFEEFGPRFPPMANAYDKELRETALKVADDMRIEKLFHVGTYACLGGPSYETIAELRMLRTCGADAVGMSTAHEVVVARHCDMKVLAFSLITNKCLLEYDIKDTTNHAEVVAVGKKREKVCAEFVRKLVHHIECPPESLSNVGF